MLRDLVLSFTVSSLVGRVVLEKSTFNFEIHTDDSYILFNFALDSCGGGVRWSPWGIDLG